MKYFHLTLRFFALAAVFASVFTVVVLAQSPSTSVNRDGAIASEDALQSPERIQVFIAAVADYPDGVLSLDFTKKDAADMKKRLISLGASESDVVFISSDVPKNIPSGKNIERRFGTFVENLREGDLAIVYLAGHGVQFDDSDESFFVPQDVDVSDVRGTSVSITKMMDALSKSKAKSRWMIVDACRDDPKKTAGRNSASRSLFASRGLGTRELGEIKGIPPFIALLQSCKPGQLSYEGGYGKAQTIKNGFFTLSLLEALDKEKAPADSNHDGQITFSEIFEYVSFNTNEKAKKYYGFEQVPKVSGDYENFTVISGVLREGLTIAKWNEAEALYKEACTLRREGNYDQARQKIEAARAINQVDERYKEEEGTIKQLEESVKDEDPVREQSFSDGIVEFFMKKPYFLVVILLLVVFFRYSSRRLRPMQSVTIKGGIETLPTSTLATPEEKSPLVAPKENPLLVAPEEKSPLVAPKENPLLVEGELLTLPIDRVNVKFHWCPAGTFMMGSPKSEKGRYSDETQHKVTLTDGFWMGETEVTQELWEAVMDNNPSYFRGKTLPVENVKWDDCQNFIAALNELYLEKGYKFSLPTEAQWEYACRAGSTGPYNGSNLDDLGWYNAKRDNKTHSVGQKTSNAWGLYDMHGNVWEWCQDWYGDYPTGEVNDPTGKSRASARVIRGGCWRNGQRDCRSANRYYGVPYKPVNYLGFRLLVSPSGVQKPAPTSTTTKPTTFPSSGETDD